MYIVVYEKTTKSTKETDILSNTSSGSYYHFLL